MANPPIPSYSGVMLVSLIVCRARNGVIGRGGAMPWRMPSDLKHFRATTLGKPVIMGRKTFQSIGKPLDGRTNYVVSRQPDLTLPGVHVVATLQAALERERMAGTAEVMIIGGGEIYRQALSIADRIYMTELHADLDGDTVFAALDPAHWRAVTRAPLATGPKDDYPADVIVVERRR